MSTIPPLYFNHQRIRENAPKIRDDFHCVKFSDQLIRYYLKNVMNHFLRPWEEDLMATFYLLFPRKNMLYTHLFGQYICFDVSSFRTFKRLFVPKGK